MKKSYDPKKIEKKWQSKWQKSKIYKAKDNSNKPKYYVLMEFPYPSGDGLHTGHLRGFTAMDIIARKRRAEGYNVLFPIGWDAFGLPTENYAIKTGEEPKKVTKKNTDNFRKQAKSLGYSFDWDREINTSDPGYYKWTQWIFLEMFKRGFAYKKEVLVNWCLSCRIGLANEEVIQGKCERCDGETELRNKEQWMLAITKHAERLEKNLTELDFINEVKTQQRNWIGKSKGSLIDFWIIGKKASIKVFTTRADTIFGATYLVLAPDLQLLDELKDEVMNWREVLDFRKKTAKKTEIERTNIEQDKDGIMLRGLMVRNPANGKDIPVWISDFVLKEYGTGAIMAVPAHDTRDYIFAKKFNLPIVHVIKPHALSSFPRNAEDIAAGASDSLRLRSECWEGSGELINSENFNGMDNVQAAREITKKVNGQLKTIYKLRDWVFSRQRYWGEPIPVVYCEKCASKHKETREDISVGEKINPGWIPLPEKDLPLLLPKVKNYKPGDDGESPLAGIDKWINVKCPRCGGVAKRESDVMPNWAGSSWYFLRYTDPHSRVSIASATKLNYFMPVDWYNGGMEHTTLHLLYSRFWNQFLFDIGVVPFEEPYRKRTSHGLILGKGGIKMSKSKGNVVNPDTIVRQFGADTLRLYEMFMGPFDQDIAWSTENIIGVRKFLEKIWEYSNEFIKRGGEKITDTTYKNLLHETIDKVSHDIENMRFNTAISQLMILINSLKHGDSGVVLIEKTDLEIVCKLLVPFAPHVASEIWERLGSRESIHSAAWPKAEAKLLRKDKIRIAVQVNGKTRGFLEFKTKLSEPEIRVAALQLDSVKKWTAGGKIKRVIYVPGKIISIVLNKTK